MRPEEHWKAGVDQIQQIEDLLASGASEIDPTLRTLAELHLAAALAGAQLQRFTDLTRAPQPQPPDFDRPAVVASLRETFRSGREGGGDGGGETADRP